MFHYYLSKQWYFLTAGMYNEHFNFNCCLFILVCEEKCPQIQIQCTESRVFTWKADHEQAGITRQHEKAEEAELFTIPEFPMLP